MTGRRLGWGTLSYLPRHASGRAVGRMHHGGSVELGCEPGTLRPQNGDLTTRPPWPHIVCIVCVLYCVVSHTISNHFSSLQNSIMPFGLVNPMYSPYGQFVINYTHPRKPLCSVSNGHIAGVTDNLTEARTDVRSVMSPYRSTVCTSFHVYPFN
ncbi:hypothetical protein AVEN_238178-1 [Araneus ventricosus]|uniref:Uncharacterized protein n=1 Tax=Araneus ventricosus TaxID=182803 RepID=A0A4Y2G8X3_ARAVE|nr:hypothetical protein AVEN_238178-1 [Araneus ventricosus]